MEKSRWDNMEHFGLKLIEVVTESGINVQMFDIDNMGSSRASTFGHFTGEIIAGQRC